MIAWSYELSDSGQQRRQILADAILAPRPAAWTFGPLVGALKAPANFLSLGSPSKFQ